MFSTDIIKLMPTIAEIKAGDTVTWIDGVGFEHKEIVFMDDDEGKAVIVAGRPFAVRRLMQTAVDFRKI